ncbi:hypothetical protein ACWDYH_02515 [Nocardia goodfellowii]
MTEKHWHHAVIEPPVQGSGKFRFDPAPRTWPEAKAAVLPMILVIDFGPPTTIELTDLCQRNAALASKWLCGPDPAIEVRGYTFVVLDCATGDCARSYLAFQRMVTDRFQHSGRLVLLDHDQPRPHDGGDGM